MFRRSLPLANIDSCFFVEMEERTEKADIDIQLEQIKQAANETIDKMRKLLVDSEYWILTQRYFKDIEQAGIGPKRKALDHHYQSYIKASEEYYRTWEENALRALISIY